MSAKFKQVIYAGQKLVDESGGGGDITVESLNVTSNGTYTAPEKTAYSPVNVNVSSGRTVIRETVTLFDGDITSDNTGEAELEGVTFENGDTITVTLDAGTEMEYSSTVIAEEDSEQGTINVSDPEYPFSIVYDPVAGTSLLKLDYQVFDMPLIITKTTITASPALANWGQNDIYADDYIEGRTHYSEYSYTYEYLLSAYVNVYPSPVIDDWWQGELANRSESPIIVGNTYKVTIDDNEYTAVCDNQSPDGNNNPNILIEGVCDIFWDGSSNLEAAFPDMNGHMVQLDSAVVTETVHKLDSKYLPDEYVSVPADIRFDATNVSHTFTEGPNKVEMPITKIILVNPKTGSNLTLDSSKTDLIYNDIFPTFYRTKYIPIINDPNMEKGPIYNDQWQYSKLCHSINIKPATSSTSNPGLKGNYCFYVFFAPNYEEINPNQTRAQQLAGMALPVQALTTLLVKRSLFD